MGGLGGRLGANTLMTSVTGSRHGRTSARVRFRYIKALYKRGERNAEKVLNIRPSDTVRIKRQVAVRSFARILANIKNLMCQLSNTTIVYKHFALSFGRNARLATRSTVQSRPYHRIPVEILSLHVHVLAFKPHPALPDDDASRDRGPDGLFAPLSYNPKKNATSITHRHYS